MDLITKLIDIWGNSYQPFIIYKDREISFSEVLSTNIDLSSVKSGDVVVLIGDFDPQTIYCLLRLIDLNCIVVPLTIETEKKYQSFFEIAHVDVVIRNGIVLRREHNSSHSLINGLKNKGHAGLILFTSGTTGEPKAILHDLTENLFKSIFFYKESGKTRPPIKIISFLLFDHIAGINTLFRTLFYKDTIVVPESRSVGSILDLCQKYQIEALPTSPTFLRMMLMSDLIPDKVPKSLKIITYGSECMDQPTLSRLCELLPSVDFKQTFGMSELGVVRTTSISRDSLYMKIDGKGIETKVVDGVLWIRSQSRMIGYLNAESPFDQDGWLNTKDIVSEEKDGYYKIIGRTTNVINVGGLKFMASEVEEVALKYPNISLVKAIAKNNPFTGQHVELIIQPDDSKNIDLKKFRKYLNKELPQYMIPKRIIVKNIDIGWRFKKL